MSKMVKMVDVNVNRSRMTIQLNEEILGLDLKGVSEEFVKEHISFGELHIMSKSREKDVHNLESKIRTAFSRSVVKFQWGNQKLSFMTTEMYKEFQERFKAFEKEYFAQLDEILRDYDKITEEFFNLFEQFLTNNKKKKTIMAKLRNDIPDKTIYMERFSLALCELDMDVEGNEAIQKSFVGSALALLWEMAERLENSMKKGSRIAHKTLAMVDETIEKAINMDVTNNPKLKEICDYFVKVKNNQGHSSISTRTTNSVEYLNKAKEGIQDLAFELKVNKMIKW